MFFFWFAKNKQFKKKGNVSGQIVPFLLVALVVLLIAAIATINIGRVSLDKTCSANAADACALAAASSWASALNALTEMNKDRAFQDSNGNWFGIKTWFDANYNTYGQLYFEADQHLNDAIWAAAEASAAAALAYVVAIAPTPAFSGGISDVSDTCTKYWYPYIEAAVLDSIAAWRAFEAAFAVQAFGITIQYMQSLTDSFYEQQRKNYCEARTFMHSSYLNSRQTGLSYAFNNSCIPAKLSDSQSNDFGEWMKPVPDPNIDPDPDANGKNFPDSSEAYKSGVYKWMDKLPQEHTVSANLDLPYMTSYELQHTQAAYSQISALLDGLIQDAQSIADKLNSTAVILGSTAAMFIIAFIINIITVSLYKCKAPWCAAAFPGFCSSMVFIHQELNLEQGWIVSSLAAIVEVVGAFSLDALRDDNDKAFDGWAPDGMRTSAGCADVEDLMIVKINKVNMPSWITTCQATQQHPGTSSGILATEYPKDGVTSISKAKFSGGDVGGFNDTYDASIVETK